MDMKELGELVRRERERRGMRGIDLAAATGRDPGWVSRLENGTLKEIPDPPTLQRLADAIGQQVARLLKAIGYRLGDDAPAIPLDPDRAELIDVIERELTDRDARVLLVTARAIVEERDARTVAEAEHYVFGRITPPGPSPSPLLTS